MTRLTAVLVAAALLLPAGARAQGFDCSEAMIRCSDGRCTRCDGSPVVTWSSSTTTVPQIAGPIAAQPDRSWHLLIRRSGLTKQDCEDWRDDFKGNADASAECFQ
jgi:hypothetical protein